MNKTLFSNRTKILRLDRGRKGIQEFIAAWQSAESPTLPRTQRLIDLYEMIMLDNHLSGVIENRKHKVLGESFLLLNAKGEESEAVELLKKTWFDEFVAYTLDAIYFGYSLIELKEFDREGKLQHIALVERRNIVPKTKEVLINSYDTSGEKFDSPAYTDYYVWVHTGLGLLLKAAPMVIYKRFSMASHASYNERFGLPSIIVRTDRDDEEKRQIEEQMLKVGNDGLGILSKDDEINYFQPNAGADASKTFENLTERVNSEISKLILGHTKAADDEAKNAQQTYINKEAINKTPSEERAESDMVFVQNIVNEQLLPRLIRFGYPFEGLTFIYNRIRNQKIAENQKTITPDLLKVVLEHYELPEEFFEKNFGLKVLPKQNQTKQNPFSSLNHYQNLYHLHDQIGSLYGIVNGIDDEIAKLFKKFQKAYEEISTKIYTGTKLLFDKTIAKLTATQLAKTLQISEDLEKDQALRYNIFYFSGAKTYQQLKEINAKLLDENGKVKPFEQFYKDVKTLNELYNRNYLQAEYEHAIASAQMISFWKENVTKNPNVALKYSAVGDSRTTPLCRKLDGLVLPANDRFWAIYYPPNHWRCRSRVLVVDERPTDLPQNLEKPDGIFASNVATQGIMFPQKHPYYDNIPQKIQEKIKKFAEDAQKSDK
ncbi:phage portal protein family protein [Raineya sp.]